MNYLKVWTSFREVIAPLSEAEIGRLFVAMLTYAETGEEPEEFRGNERFLWPVAKQGIDQTALKNDVLRVNGLKGGRPRTNDNQEKPNETKQNQTEANESLKDKVNINIKKEKKDNILTDIREKRFVAPTKEEILDWCLSEKIGLDVDKFYDYYSSVGWKVGGKAPMKDWKAAVRNWMRRAEENTKPTKTVVAQQYSQRDYSKEQDEALKRMLELGAM